MQHVHDGRLQWWGEWVYNASKPLPLRIQYL